MEIRDNLTNVNYNYRGTNPSWIVIHNTANGNSSEGMAWNNTQYFKDTYRSASAHYFVDDGPIVWRCVRDTDTAWHVGEAQSRNGCYNYNAIGIEVCETSGGWFTDNEIATLQELVPWLMDKYGIPPERVCRHYDVTGKSCPWYYKEPSRWWTLKEEILEGDMPSVADIWNYDINGLPARERLYLDNVQLFDRKDYSGRGKDGSTPIERLTWMAAKQEKMQDAIDELDAKVDAIIGLLSGEGK